jgi:hypothetical protein
MKKLLSIASGLFIGTAMLHAQGEVVFTSIGLGILTNTGFSSFGGGSETGGISGNAATVANGGSFMYALFIQPYTGTLSSTATNPIENGWNLATIYGTGAPVIATNGVIPGGLFGPGGASGVAIDGWAFPTNEFSYLSSGREYFMIAGWSTSLGTSWEQLSDLLADNFATFSAPGFFGVSTIGNGYAGGGPLLLPESLFGNNAVTQGVGAFTMYEIPIPEPTTMALAGLGGLSLLLFSRRK